MASSPEYALFVKNASQIVTVGDNGALFKRGDEMDKVSVVKNASMVVDTAGFIVDIGPAAEIEKKFSGKTAARTLDATGKCILPGLVDAHTHPVWSGDRVHEFKMKLAGASYMEVHKMGGGINFTVRHTHESPQAELATLFHARLDRMLRFGTTVLEAKSGYGLTWPQELKMLKVLHEANKSHAIDIVANYCGAHSVPKGLTAEQATADILNNQIPQLVKLRKGGVISPQLIDVFCEKGVFGHEQSKEILAAGKKVGLHVNFHGDELHCTNSAELAVELKAAGVSHLERVSPQGIEALAKSEDTVAVLLPTTAYVLRIEPPPARKLIDSGAIVGLGTDFNPNAHTLSMPFVMNLACVTMKMTVNEALVAATLNSAASLRMSDRCGSLEKGKWADFIVLDNSQWEHIVYDFVDPPISAVYKHGKEVFHSPFASATASSSSSSASNPNPKRLKTH